MKNDSERPKAAWIPIGRVCEPGELPDFVLLDPVTTGELRELPQQGDAVWLGSQRPTGVRIQECGPVDVVLWVEAESGEIRACAPADPRHPATTWLEALLEAMREPRPLPGLAPCRPGWLLVDDERVVDLLRQGCRGLEIGVFTAARAELEPLERALARLSFLPIEERPKRG